uniref:Putative na+iodide/myo-inositol/multivitamin symporter n=1 Tax=Ixodes ricinus TaxID=34613 RepID=A0A6B0VCX3_IXORI
MVRDVHLAEYAVFGILMGANLAVGLYFALNRRSRRMNSDEAFLGSRTLGIVPLSLSILATLVSAIGVVGFTAHFYTYGLHWLWSLVPLLFLVPVVSRIVVPVFYNLKITSVFEYLRLRFGNKMGIIACFINFVISMVLGAVSTFAAGVAISTAFHFPSLWSILATGAACTIYTAFGGFRGVIWTDAMQAILILVCPLTVVIKIIYDSSYGPDVNLRRPVDDVDIQPYFLEASFDLTKEENVWACIFGSIAPNMYRMGVGQMIVQRYAAAKSLQEAQSTVYLGNTLFFVTFALLGVVGMSLIYWYRDCDPFLLGAISRVDQLVPYYVGTRLSGFPGFSGLFLTGVVSATLSTVSSAINSLAATFYIDVLLPYMSFSEDQANMVTKALAFGFGASMTLLAIIVPYLESAVRLFTILQSSAAGPFVGLYILALAFPWANSKGAVTSTILVLALQLWALIGKFSSGPRPPKMAVTLDSCPANFTRVDGNATLAWTTHEQRGENVFPLYMLSAYWGGFFSMVLTVVVGLLISVMTGGGEQAGRHIGLTSDVFIQFWKRLKLLPDSDANSNSEKGKTETVQLNDITDISSNW